jgi:hypothetical protein
MLTKYYNLSEAKIENNVAGIVCCYRKLYRHAEIATGNCTGIQKLLQEMHNAIVIMCCK